MQNILRALELKEELDTLRPLNSAQEDKIMQKFRLDWNYHSNHLEGNSLTFGETKNLILHGITAQGKPLKDHFEITGHNEALNWVLEIVKEDRPLTENFIRELHTLLLKESYEVDAITPEGNPTRKRIEVGKYKTTPNHVKTSTGEIFRFAEPEETPAKMHDLLEWYRLKKEEKDTNPIVLAAQFHYKFIVIHPFDDGNGRMARILMNFILMGFGYPPVIIKTDDKIAYFFALRQADNGDIDSFVDYIAKNLVRSLEIMIAGAKGESIEEPDDIDKNIALLEQRLKGLGEKPEVFKNKRSMQNIIDSSFKELLVYFVESNNKLAKFYATTSLELNIDNLQSQPNTIEKIIELVSYHIANTSSTNSVSITYNFVVFAYPGFQEFNYNSPLTFNFTTTKYEIKGKTNSISKFYNERLTKDEITELVNKDIKYHSKVIENETKKIENKKRGNDK